jgi:glycosyltransferase involved in cell wall biosynthesis/tetratricopeptide (TPR) repeat protein
LEQKIDGNIATFPRNDAAGIRRAVLGLLASYRYDAVLLNGDAPILAELVEQREQDLSAARWILYDRHLHAGLKGWARDPDLRAKIAGHDVDVFAIREIIHGGEASTAGISASGFLEDFVSVGLREHRVHLSSWAIDEDFFRATPPAEGEPPIVFAGGDTGRDYTTFIEAIRDLPVSVRLVTGSPPGNLPPNVTVLPRLELWRFRDEISRASMVVVPLSGETPVSGITVIVMAHMMGRPVIATAIPAVREYFRGDEGAASLTPPGDVSALREAIRRLVQDPVERARSAEAGLALARRRNRLPDLVGQMFPAATSEQRSRRQRDGWLTTFLVLDELPEADCLRQLEGLGSVPLPPVSGDLRSVLAETSRLSAVVPVVAATLREYQDTSSYLAELRRMTPAAGDLFRDVPAGAVAAVRVALSRIAHAPAGERLVTGLRALATTRRGVGRSLAAAIAGLQAPELDRLIQMGGRLSLVGAASGRENGAIAIDPLIAEILRVGVDEPAIIQRMSVWFLPRLRAGATGSGADEAQAEAAVLSAWLGGASDEQAPAVAAAGAEYAAERGPFLPWLRLLERARDATTSGEQRDRILKALAAVALRSGAPFGAVQSEERRGVIDQARRSRLAAARDEIDEARTLLGRTMAAVFDVGSAQEKVDPDAAARVIREQILPVAMKHRDDGLRVDALGSLVETRTMRGDHEGALKILQEEGVPASARLGDERTTRRMLERMTAALSARGKPGQALRVYRDELLPVGWRDGDPVAEAEAAEAVAALSQANGDSARGVRLLREAAIPVYERLGERRALARVVAALVDMLVAAGDIDAALRLLREEYPHTFEQAGISGLLAAQLGRIAEALQRRGDFQRGQGDLSGALQSLQDRADVLQLLGDAANRMRARGEVADLLISRGEVEAGLEILRTEILPAVEQGDDLVFQGLTYERVAAALIRMGSLEEARQVLEQKCLPALEKAGDRRERAIALNRLAEVLERRGDWKAALKTWRSGALPLFVALGEMRFAARTRIRMARVLLRHRWITGRREASSLLRDVLNQGPALQDLAREADSIRRRYWLRI